MVYFVRGKDCWERSPISINQGVDHEFICKMRMTETKVIW